MIKNALKNVQYRIIVSVICCSFYLHTIAQSSVSIDTLTLSLPEVEKRFIDSNLQLLSAHFNVDAQKALIQQAKLWNNPVLNTDQVIAANGKFLPYGKNSDGSYNGQFFIQIQQLIQTARKRGKLVDLATTNTKLSELQLQDLLRNLRYQLHIDYYTIQQQLSNKAILEAQLHQLNHLLNGMQAQLSLGNIAQKDYLRIQALVIALQQDITDLNKSIADTQSDIKTLLQLKDYSFVKPLEQPASEIELTENTASLFETARQNNPYYQLQQTQTIFQQQNLVYQKALRVPDITLSPNFDKNSNYAPNYVGLGISLPIPLLNKNQGNIKSAEFSVKQQEAITQSAETELQNNISNAYTKLLLTLQQNNNTQLDFYKKYKAMYSNVLNSYQQKQIGLLEFLDFFNDYTSSQQRLVQQELNVQLSKEELNYNIGIDVIK